VFRKVDLHVHTTASNCYLDSIVPEAQLHTTPQDIVLAAREKGLEGIALVDHNTAGGIEGVRQAAGGNPVVFPGIEVSAQGGHVLAIFPEDSPITPLSSLLLALGIEEEQAGLGYEETFHPIDQVFRMVAERGGLAIAAHTDRRPKGFLAADSLTLADKRRIYTSPYLAALELTIPQDRFLWGEGKAPGFPEKRSCIQGSDAHAPDEMGRRPVFIWAPQLNFSSLKKALQEGLIRFPGDPE